MSVPNVREEVNLILRCEQSSTDRVDGCVTPALVVEAAGLVEVFEEFAVSFASPEIKVANLEVTPD